MNFPLEPFIQVSAANPWTYVVFALIGFAFGFTLEMSGFGDSRKLAAQFYFTEMTVLKVMFTAIAVAMVLTFGAVGLGLLNFNLVWVNPTYLASGVLGGLIMGVGFIVGGFCPTTSLASASTGKIDGMFFVLGGFVGAFLFGETEQLFTEWYNYAGYFGRITLMDVFNLPAGVIVLLVVMMALFMFWGAEQLERLFGKRDLSKEPKLRVYGAAALFGLAAIVLLIGVPSTDEKYAKLQFNRTINEQKVTLTADEMIAQRQMQIEPAELFHSMNDDAIKVKIFDVRNEADYNLFHVHDAENVPLENIKGIVPDLLAVHTPNTVYVLVGNGETAATEAWQTLSAEGIANVYILEGGVNNWIAVFGQDDPEIKATNTSDADALNFTFPAALGDRYACSDPSPIEYETLEYTPKIQLELKRDKSGGGCG